VLAVIALFIAYEAIERFLSPVPISFREAIPIAVVGLVVNIVSAWLLSGDHHGHSHGGHSHSHGGGTHAHGDGGSGNGPHGHAGGQGLHGPGDTQYTVAPADTRAKAFAPRAAHAHSSHGHAHDHDHHDHAHGAPGHAPHGADLHSSGHSGDHPATPAQATIRDNSIRSAYVHVLADAIVSVLAITGLILAKVYGWLWMDPLAGIIGAVVIANWSVTLIRDTAGVLLDVCPDEITRERVRRAIETDGDQVVDLHLWRLGPGHLAAVVAIATARPRDATFYRARLASFACLSHITVEVTRAEIS